MAQRVHRTAGELALDRELQIDGLRVFLDRVELVVVPRCHRIESVGLRGPVRQAHRVALEADTRGIADVEVLELARRAERLHQVVGHFTTCFGAWTAQDLGLALWAAAAAHTAPNGGKGRAAHG